MVRRTAIVYLADRFVVYPIQYGLLTFVLTVYEPKANLTVNLTVTNVLFQVFCKLYYHLSPNYGTTEIGSQSCNKTWSQWLL